MKLGRLPSKQGHPKFAPRTPWLTSSQVFQPTSPNQTSPVTSSTVNLKGFPDAVDPHLRADGVRPVVERVVAGRSAVLVDRRIFPFTVEVLCRRGSGSFVPPSAPSPTRPSGAVGRGGPPRSCGFRRRTGCSPPRSAERARRGSDGAHDHDLAPGRATSGFDGLAVILVSLAVREPASFGSPAFSKVYVR